MNQQSSTSAVEGSISFRDYRVWYRIVKPNQEELGKLPLLCLHGGPGVPHDYLLPGVIKCQLSQTRKGAMPCTLTNIFSSRFRK